MEERPKPERTNVSFRAYDSEADFVCDLYLDDGWHEGQEVVVMDAAQYDRIKEALSWCHECDLKEVERPSLEDGECDMSKCPLFEENEHEANTTQDD